MMTPEQEQQRRANDLAAQIAIAELLRTLIGEVCFTEDRDQFRRRLAAIEEATVGRLASRRLWKDSNEATEEYVKTAAQGWITTLMTSILHPADAAGKAGG